MDQPSTEIGRSAPAVQSRDQEVGEALPNLVVIGAQKCGTTAAHYYLAHHPEVSMSRPKELDFFIAEKNWDRGVDWYRSHFDAAAKIRGESSPNYTADPELPGVPERMASLIPEAKLIFIVRDPIDRARAAWIHNYANRVQDKPLNRAVLEDEQYVARSRYHHQLGLFLEHYPMERILVLEQEELMRERKQTLRRLFGFIGVREDYWDPRAYERKRLATRGRRRKTRLGVVVSRQLPTYRWARLRGYWPFTTEFEHSELDDAVRAELADRLRDDIDRFRELTGRPFANWSV